MIFLTFTPCKGSDLIVIVITFHVAIPARVVAKGQPEGLNL